MKFDRDNNKYEQCVPQQPVTLTPGFIKKWYEINPDTNAFTDAEKLKLESITDGKDGLDGKDGKDGTDGINGTDGTNGKDGKEGQQGLTGNEGPQGLQGDKGIPGTNTPAPGPTGPKGAKGDKGDRGTNGTDGIIGKDGTDGAGGLKGDKGDTGDRGLPGPQGVKGHVGSDGPRGVSGKDGANGSLGNPGPTGPTGSAGKDGTGVTIKGSDTKANILAKTGVVGDMWIVTDVGADKGTGMIPDGNGSGIAHWTNVGHIVGPKGDTGPQGQTGANGSNGADSTVAGPTGPQGSDGGQGIQGIRGLPSTVPGPTGLQGIRGEKGDTGIDGPQGPTGHTGLTGPQGAVGPKGPKGDSGSGTGGGLSPEDQAKLDLIQVDPTTHDMTIDSDILRLGSGAKDVALKLHNPSDKNGVIEGDGAKGTWYVGSFPNSTIHPDDLVLSNTGGGLFTSIADGAKWSVRYGSDTVSFTKAELQAVKAGGGSGGPGMLPADKVKLDFLTVTKAANVDTMTDNIQVAFNRIDALGLDASGTNLVSNDEIELVNTQVISGDPAVVAKDNRLITVANGFALELALKDHVDKEFEHKLGKPASDDQILSSKKDGTRSWIDAPSGGAGIAPGDQTKLDHITVTKDIDLDTVSTVQHLHGTTVPADTLGKDGDTYFKVS